MDSRTPLTEAAQMNQLDMVQLLPECGPALHKPFR